ncbi:MAG: threonine/serine exporter family protein, partial [Bacteroidales bacterium]|nr:threonine/serine exporter family protein [Bacteroidales bacterium]
MMKKESLSDVGEFMAEYASHLTGCGVHSSRVIRNSKRIGEAFGYTVKISMFQKSMILSLHDEQTHETFNEVVETPSLPISFEHNSELSALSWEAYDYHLSLETMKAKYRQIITKPRIHPILLLILVSCANASFCRLFGGDWYSMGIVWVATYAGFYVKQRMTKNNLNHYIITIISAFIASLCASASLLINTTSDIALATSVLFLVPG